jgi:hypothetical protein
MFLRLCAAIFDVDHSKKPSWKINVLKSSIGNDGFEQKAKCKDL